MASTELTKLSSDLATQNGVTSPDLTITTDSTSTPESTTTGPSQALKDMSIAMSPKTPNRPITTPAVAAPETADQIQAKLLKSSQAEINSINQYAAKSIEAAKPRQDERLRETSSVNTLTGLAGSTEANRTTEATTAVNKRENDLIRAEAQTKVSAILTGVKTKALEMAQTAKENFRLDTKAASDERVARLTEATQNAAMLAQSGVTYEGLQTTDPEAYQALSDAVGGEQLLKAQFTLNRPQEDILDKKIENGKYVIAYRNPITGATRIESVDLGLPPQYTKTVDAGNRILAIPDNWDGDPAELLTINKGLTPGQAATGSSGGDTGGIYDVLDFRTANAVIAQSEKFNSSDIVKRLNASQQAYNAVQNIDPATQNPADHQALIYDFAKALDPESVVREGEYETIKKYSQNIINKYKGEVENAINGTGFLSQEAIANIKSTIDTRYQSQLKQYRNKADETARVIDTIAGKPVAQMVIQDYEGGAITNNQSGVLRSPDGSQEVNTADLTPDELQEAKDAGWQ
jgi:hypothetical protein